MLIPVFVILGQAYSKSVADQLYDLRKEYDHEEEENDKFSGRWTQAQIAEHDKYKLELQNSKEHLLNFKKLSEEVKVIEKVYEYCIESISANKFSEVEIEKCTGNNFEFIFNDIRYIEKKIFAGADDKIGDLFLSKCYEKDLKSEPNAIACDLFESDVKDMLWGGVAFSDLIERNVARYTEEYSKMDLGQFTEILKFLKLMESLVDDLVEELWKHKVIAMDHLETQIDKKRRVIQNQSLIDPLTQPLSDYKHTIVIKQKVEPKTQPIQQEFVTIGSGGFRKTRILMDETIGDDSEQICV